MTAPIVVWFRNELRLSDHPALAAAAAGAPILPLYILDDATPGGFHIGGASRWWLHGSLAALEYLNPEVRDDPATYPPPEARARLHPVAARSQEYSRALNRAWTRVKAGE